MRERLRLIGGELTVTSRSGQGTTIEARAPLASAHRVAGYRRARRYANAGSLTRSSWLTPRERHGHYRRREWGWHLPGYDSARVSAPPLLRRVADGDSPNTAL